MKIEFASAKLDPSAPASAHPAAAGVNSDSFANHYARRRQELEDKAAAIAERAAEKAAKKQEQVATEHKSLVAELNDYLSKSPAQHLRDAIMKEMGITEEDLAAMPPEQRRATEVEIGQRIRERLASTEKNRGGRPGELEQGGPCDPKLLALDLAKSAGEARHGATTSSSAAFFASLLAGGLQ